MCKKFVEIKCLGQNNYIIIFLEDILRIYRVNENYFVKLKNISFNISREQYFKLRAKLLSSKNWMERYGIWNGYKRHKKILWKKVFRIT